MLCMQCGIAAVVLIAGGLTLLETTGRFGNQADVQAAVQLNLNNVEQRDVAVGFGSAGKGTGGASKSKDVNDDMGLLSTREDLNDFKQYCVDEDWFMAGTINADGMMLTAQNVLANIERICTLAHRSDKRLLIYYTGHGEQGTGNWCFTNNGRISLDDIMKRCDPLPRYGLMIKSDCCYSGKWAYEAQRKGYNIIVETASGPSTTALDRIYAKGYFKKIESYKDRVTKRGAVRYEQGKVEYIDGKHDFELALLNKYNQHGADYYLTGQAFSSDAATLIVSTMPWTAQVHFNGEWEVVKRKIAKHWSAGYQLTDIAYTKYWSWWSAVMSKGSGISGDNWHTRASLGKLNDAIKDCWDKGHVIIDVTYGDSKWLLHEGKTDDFGPGQSWQWSRDFSVIRDFIKKWWDKGRSITSISKGQESGIYFVVMSQTKKIGKQRWGWQTEDNVYAYIKKAYADGLVITRFWDDYDFDKNQRYFVVASQVSDAKFFPLSTAGQSVQRGLQLSAH